MIRAVLPAVAVAFFVAGTALAQELREREEAKIDADIETVIEGIKSDKTKRRVREILESGAAGIIGIGDAKKGQVGRLGIKGMTSAARPSATNPREWVMTAVPTVETNFRIDQIVDDRNMIIGGYRAWVEGVNTSEFIDDSLHDFRDYTFECVGNKQYETDDGTRTVRHFVLVDPDGLNDILKEIGRLSSFRAWVDKDEKHAVRAQFVDFKGGKVLLRNDKGKELSVKITQLSKEDQAWVKAAIKK